MTTIAVAGASGYAGGELLRYLAQHPTFDLLAACAAGRAGEPLVQVHPQFAGTSWARMMLDETTPEVLNQADLVFLALPHGESAAIVKTLDADVQVVDLGADLRLASADAWVTGAKSPLRRRGDHADQPLRGARLPNHGAGAALGDLERGHRVINCGPAASRAQKFPRFNSLSMSISRA